MEDNERAEKKYTDAILKIGEHAFEKGELIPLLNAMSISLSTILCALPVFSEYQGPVLERAKAKNITPEEAFDEIFVEKLKQDIIRGKEGRTKAAGVSLAIMKALEQFEPEKTEKMEEIQRKLIKFAGPNAVNTGAAEATSEPEIETMKGMDLVLQAIQKAKSRENQNDNNETKGGDTGGEAPSH